MEQLKNSRNFPLSKKGEIHFKVIFPSTTYNTEKKYKEGRKNQSTEGGREWKEKEAGMKTENTSGKNKRKKKNTVKSQKLKTKHTIVLTALRKLEEN